ncbi:MAG: pyridoxamine 5'-phosphate oxidase [Pirellulaceae bacterium]
MNTIQELRKEYELHGLDRAELYDNPMQQFDVWFRDAIRHTPGKWYEPNAMTLSTSESGIVTSRTVLLKDYDEVQFVFFTDYGSEKGRQLESNPRASLLFHWHFLGRQIRIVGRVEKTTREISAEYFHKRPRGAQLSAYVSAQSCALESREHLQHLRTELEQKLAGDQVPLPDDWGGYSLQPDRLEFWQGRRDRAHDRFQYTRSDEGTGGWVIVRLAP